MRNKLLTGISCWLLLLAAAESPGQDYSWWNRKHRWDGTTPWSAYLILSPAYMGPNALPVPEVRDGSPPAAPFIEAGPELHLSEGDRTGNLYTRIYVPLFSDRAGIDLSYVPVEVYRTDTLTRDRRRSREYDAKGTSLGDLYIGTFIHLLRERDLLPDLMLTVNLKTASGTGFQAARHTDAPGYFFDLSAGKTLHRGTGTIRLIRAHLQAGFYVYQTNLENYRQNDAFLYGAGFQLETGRFLIEPHAGGYMGYLKLGDRPLVGRLDLTFDPPSALLWKLRIQKGSADFPYTSFRFTVRYCF